MAKRTLLRLSPYGPDPRFLKKRLTKHVHSELSRWTPESTTKRSVKGPLQVIDFFCGCGGMSLGFAAVNRLAPVFRIVGGCDLDPEAVATFSRNFDAPGIATDVRDIYRNPRNLQSLLPKLDSYNPSDPLIVIGCAPCQGFTSHRKKSWFREDSRNDLVAIFATIAVALKPVCVIMENVPEMLSQKYWQHFETARNILHAGGFTVRQAIYNAADFGVPQERFRSIVIAMRRDFLLPSPLYLPHEYLTVKNAIGDLPHVSPGRAHPSDPLHRSARHSSSTIKTIRAVPRDGGSRPAGVGPPCLDRVRGFYDVYGRLSWTKPAITITHYARNPASGRFVHPDQNRGLTMREAARLQSFPDGFEFRGPFDATFKQIGEAVPPKLAAAIAVSTLIELAAPLLESHQPYDNILSVQSPVSSSFSSVIAGIKIARGKNAFHVR